MPPAIDRHRVFSSSQTSALDLGVRRAATRSPCSSTTSSATVLAVADAEQLGHARLRARALPGERAQRRADAEQRADGGQRDRVPDRDLLGGAEAAGGGQRRRHARCSCRACWSAIATRSLASVVRASRQPSPGSPDQAVVGHEHVVEEDLVEQRLAGDLAQRADVDAGAASCRPGSR